MFGSRRHRTPNPQPLTAATANPNAATAAASAFSRQASNQSLSSAAAAAALRARPTTPINVAEVQTKRTARRSASVSSRGSLDGPRGGSLRRTPSTGSMTERTFRSPSPHRPPPSKTPLDAPPVPTIPAGVESKPGAKGPSRRRALSLQTQPLKLASQTMKEGRGSWYGPATVGDPSNVRTTDQALSDIDTRPGSISPSINFSYPRGARVGSPTEPSPAIEAAMRSMKGRPSSTASDRDLVFDPNSRRMVSRAELLAKEQSLSQPSNRAPTKKKKQSPARSGSHLAHGTVARTTGAAVESETPPRARHVSPQSLHTRHAAEAPELVSSQIYDEMGAEVNVEPKVPTSQTQRHGDVGFEIEQPTPRRPPRNEQVSFASRSEGHEAAAPADSFRRQETQHVYEIAEGSTTRKTPVRALDAVPVRSSTYSKTQSPIELPADAEAVETAPGSENASTTTDASQPDEVRMSSRSPPRTAHFATTEERLAVPVLHSPPPRSVSPRKSALKQSAGPNRDVSPSDEASESSGDANIAGSSQQEPPVSRKKSVRVSFDDQNTIVVGEAASPADEESPVFHSPQTRRPWYNLGRRKKDMTPIDDDEEVMKPRPALPSFGSVREKKVREAEERPLVRPREPAYSPPHSGSPSILPRIPSGDELGSEYGGPSSDHAIGAVLALDASRNEANISKFREPLPPEVTSVEGTGYVSMSSTSSSPATSDDDEEPVAAMERAVLEPEPTMPPELVKEEIIASTKPPNGSAKATTDESGSEEFEDAETPKAVPQIAFTLPSPTSSPRSVQKAPQSKAEPAAVSEPEPEPEPEPPALHFDVPGGFPEDDSDELKAVPVKEKTKVPQPETRQVEMQVPRTEPITPPRSARSSKAPTLSPPVEEESESDTSAIYSDAYEDLSDAEGDGFLSLDAVVESPVSSKVSQKLFEKALSGSSKDKTAQEQQEAPPEVAVERAQPAEVELDWDQAKAYWRSLTAEKRRQLEAEAVKEAGEEGDLDELRKAKKKAKKKKSMEHKVAEGKRPQKPQKPEKEKEKEKAAHPERTYQIQPGTKVANAEERPASTMRTTLRGSAPSARAQQPSRRSSQPQPPIAENGRLRKSLRGSQTGSPHTGPIVSSGHAMRQSMRSDAPAPTPAPAPSAAAVGGTLRKSLRSPPTAPPSVVMSDSGVGMRKSLRSNGGTQASRKQERPTAAEVGRPSSYHEALPTARESPKVRRRNWSVDEATPPKSVAGFMNPLRRRGSDSSESSFVRSRPRPKALESLGFRKTMRVEPPQPSPTQGSDTSKSRFRIRSLSPAGSPFRRNSAVGSVSPPVSMGNRMRTTLRSDSSDGSTHRMRIPSFGRHKKKKDKKAGKLSSRLNDSSDEDEAAVPTAFKSRFVDSSDEDESTPAAPAATVAKGGLATKTMRGGDAKSATAAPAAMKSPTPAPAPASTSKPAPQTVEEEEEEEESESLPDSSDDEEKREEALASSSNAPQPDSPLRRKKSGRASLVGPSISPSLGTQAMGTRLGHARRGSLMAVLRRKKPETGSKIQRPERMDSAARRDTKLERSSSTLEALRSNSTSPRLASQQQAWPLRNSKSPQAHARDGEDEDDKSDADSADLSPTARNDESRPATAAAPDESSPRPGILNRRSTSHSILSFGRGHSTHESQPELRKKKKFHTLRKVFGLDD